MSWPPPSGPTQTLPPLPPAGGDNGGDDPGFDNPWGNALFSPGVGGAYFGAANRAVNYATIGTIGAYAGAFALPYVAPVVANGVGYGVGYAQGALAGSGGVLLGKYLSSTNNYMLDAQEMGLSYFNLGNVGWNVLNYFGNATVANQGFLDAVVDNGVPIYLGSQPLTSGTYAWELEYLFQLGVSNGTLIPVW